MRILAWIWSKVTGSCLHQWDDVQIYPLSEDHGMAVVSCSRCGDTEVYDYEGTDYVVIDED